jgi:hypothetical protein
MKRRNANPDQDGANDFERAKKNLQRALAIDDGYQPAFNQLALYYLEMAKTKAGRGGRRKAAVFVKTKKADQQMLELAALVCSQAIRKNPKYAAIHNTAGLIRASFRTSTARCASSRPRRARPTFFEAQMNYAAINLSFRGFKAAEDAYRAASGCVRTTTTRTSASLSRSAVRSTGRTSTRTSPKRRPSSSSAEARAGPRRNPLQRGDLPGVQGQGGGAERRRCSSKRPRSSRTSSRVRRARRSSPTRSSAKDRAQDIRDTVKFIKRGQTEAAIEAARQEKEKEQGTPAEEEGEAPAEG